MLKSSLQGALFDDTASTYAIIDAAKIEDLTTQLLIYEPLHRNLFEGKDAMELEEVAPYLVQLDKEDAFTHWVLEEVYGEDGAIFLQSNEEIDILAAHFRPYLHVSREIPHPETGERVIQEGILALYDPRVLPVWLESIDKEHKGAFLSAMTHLYYEDMTNTSLLRSYDTKGTKQTHKLSEEPLCV